MMKAHLNWMLGWLVLTVVPLRALSADAPPGKSADTDFLGYPTDAAKAYQQGEEEAKRDLAKSVVKVKSAGFPMPWAGDYDQLLKKKHQIEADWIGGCIVSEGLCQYQRGYNEISVAWIKQKHGTNFFDATRQQAEAAWHARIEAGAAKASSSANTHQVQSGDTLLKIARHHGVTVKALSELNTGLDPTRLQIGQTLRLPAKTKP